MSTNSLNHIDVLWLGDEACHDPARGGGKASALSRLAARHPVPPGFCLGTEWTSTYERHGHAPGGLREMLDAAYEELARRSGIAAPRLAVRSSAADEDGCASSFAGQYESYLNVGCEGLAEAVRLCIASAGSERVREYRLHHGADRGAAKMAVLVQRLVRADISAVVFSANPITGARDEVVINVSWGLGECIVGGAVSPDMLIVDKRDHSVRHHAVADKRRMTVLTDDGTAEVDVPRFMREQPAIDEATAAAMARLAIELERETGRPVDIECAVAEGELALLQCRPITTLR